MDDSGLSRDEVADEDACELTAAEMERHTYRDDDGTRRTFAEQLALEKGDKAQMFASTEY